jgi:hypothetical protein
MLYSQQMDSQKSKTNMIALLRLTFRLLKNWKNVGKWLDKTGIIFSPGDISSTKCQIRPSSTST